MPRAHDPTSPKGRVTLMAHQAKCVPLLQAALAKFGAAIDCSDLGSGKSYTGAFTADAVCPKDKRVLVVCPKAVRPSWVRIFQLMELPEDRYVVVNYELLKRGIKGLGSWRADRKRFLYNEGVGFIIFDEAHKLRSQTTTQNSMLAIGAKLSGIPSLFLSATLAESPAHFRTLGFCLGLHAGKDFSTWALNNGCTFDPWGKLALRRTVAARVMTALNAKLFPEYGVRVRRADIPDFPETELKAEAFDFGPPDAINAVYEEMENELALLAEKQQADGSRVKEAAQAMVALLRARQKVELMKVPGVADLVEDAVDEGQSVVVFCNFIATLEALVERLGRSKVAVIRGGQSEGSRQFQIDSFQKDILRIIAVQIQSGGAGTSLHDVNGLYPRVAYIFPTYSATDLRQSTGRVHRAGGKSKSIQKILFAAGTVEEKVMAKLGVKLQDLDTLNDADVSVLDRPEPPMSEENPPEEPAPEADFL